MNELFERQEPRYLEIFHAAQAKLLEGDVEAGKELLIQAAELTDDEDFLRYIKGTQAYLGGDRESLRGSISSLGEHPNAAILQKFLERLESGEEADYSSDYR